MRWMDSITHSADMSLNKLGDGEGQGGLQPMGSQRAGYHSNRTTTKLPRDFAQRKEKQTSDLSKV